MFEFSSSFKVPVIETRMLRLRMWNESDILPFHAMSQDPEVMHYLGGPKSLEESKSFVCRHAALLSSQGFGLWAVEKKRDKNFCGFVGLYKPEHLPFSPGIEIGWRCVKSQWGRGFATEAAGAVLDYSFDTLKLPVLYSYAAVANVASLAVMKKLGLHRIKPDFLPPSSRQNSNNEDHFPAMHRAFAITPMEWRTAKSILDEKARLKRHYCPDNIC